MIGAMSDAADDARDEPRRHRLRAAWRQEERVTSLELFFDLVFVLAITKCTAMMAARPTWTGLGEALMVLAVLWWAWVGYAWLTSVVDPEEGTVRVVMFTAMIGLLIAAISAPHVFDSDQRSLTFALAYALVRAAHIALFLLASHDVPRLRRSVNGLAASSAIGVALIVGASFLRTDARIALWLVAIVLDIGGPFAFGSEGWELVPGHFAERHGLMILIALGESVVAIGAAAEQELTTGTIVAIALGVVLVGSMWWLYFDVVAAAAAEHLESMAAGRPRNDLARDSYSYLHLPMVAGIVLAAFGLHDTFAEPHARLATVPAWALYGGVALYLLGHVAFRLRHIGSFNFLRLGVAGLLLALAPVVRSVHANVALAIVAGLAAAIVAYEAVREAETRDALRRAGISRG